MLTNFDLFFPCSYLIIYLLTLKLSFSHLNLKTGASGGGGAERTIIFYPTSLRNSYAYGSTLCSFRLLTGTARQFSKLTETVKLAGPLLMQAGWGRCVRKSFERAGCCSAHHLAVTGLLKGSVMGRTAFWW